MLDEYGQPRPTKLSGLCLKIDLYKCRALWKRIFRPTKNPIDDRLLEAKRQAREWQDLVEKERLTREELKKLLAHKLTNKEDLT